MEQANRRQANAELVSAPSDLSEPRPTDRDSSPSTRLSKSTDLASTDALLEGELIQLMTEMEALVEGLTQEKKQERLVRSLETAKDLIKLVFIFANERIPPEAQARVFELSQNVYDAAGSILLRIQALSRKDIDLLFSDPASSPESPRADYRRFGLALRSALEGYFTLIVEQFSQPTPLRRWSNTFRIFLDDLTRRWW